MSTVGSENPGSLDAAINQTLSTMVESSPQLSTPDNEDVMGGNRTSRFWDVEVTGRSAAELERQIEEAIASGELPPGERLPAVRALSGALSLSPSTVSSAYAALRSRGLIVTRDRSGSEVSQRPPLRSAASLGPPIPTGVRDLATGNPNPALLPRIGKDRARRGDHPEEPTLYGGTTRDADLGRRVREWLEADGVPSEHQMFAYGALDGVERALLAATRPGDVVALEDPCYNGVLDLCRSMGLAPAPVPVDDEGLTPERLSEVLSTRPVRAIVHTPRSQNPFGSAVSIRRHAELAAVLREHPSVTLIEDDHAALIEDVPHHSLAEVTQQWVVVRSLTKALGPDLRVAVVVGDATLIERMEGRQRLGCGWVSLHLQRLSAELWAKSETSGLLKRARRVYREQREGLLAALSRRDIEGHGRSGLHVWVPVTNEATVSRGLRELGWAVREGRAFRMSDTEAIRITISTLKAQEAEDFAAHLARALDEPLDRSRYA